MSSQRSQQQACHGMYIADGFNEDVNNMIEKFNTQNSLHFEVFVKIWKEMNFDEVFIGRPTVAETVDFTEEALHICKKTMTNPENSFKESVVGLYLLYATYSLQVIPDFCQIRLTATDHDRLLQIMNTARKEKHYDILYVLGRMLCGGAVQFHLAPRRYGLEKSFRRIFMEKVSSDSFKRNGVLSKKGEELTLLREISALTRNYVRCKAQIHDQPQPDKSLRYSNEHLSNELAGSLDCLLSTGVSVNYSDVSSNEKLSGSRKQIKERAMRMNVTKQTHTAASSEQTDVPSKTRRVDLKTNASPQKKTGD